MRNRLLALLVCSVLLLGAACGDDDDEAEAPATTAAEGTLPDDGGAEDEVSLTAELRGGDAEVPDPGDPDGSGTATVTLRPGESQVCYEIEVSEIATATAAHIHEGSEGEAGGIVVTFEPPGQAGSVQGCVPVEREVIDAIAENPSGHYVNVHNADHPGGAVRGQLEGS